MQVLQHEVLNVGMPLAIMIFLLIAIIVMGVGVSIEVGKITGSIIAIILTVLVVNGYLSQKDDYYEYQKVIVEDWNVVHNEGWEVIKQEGEIVELKRKLKEE